MSEKSWFTVNECVRVLLQHGCKHKLQFLCVCAHTQAKLSKRLDEHARVHERESVCVREREKEGERE